MSMDADVIGIGPITKEIRECDGLDYDKEKYKDLPIGTIITSRFFYCVTTGMSMQLAEALGVSAFKFATHLLTATRPPGLFDWKTLQEVSEDGKSKEDAAREVECFNACCRAGWTLIYRPNF